MALLSQLITPRALSLPHVPLGIALEAGLAILAASDADVCEERGREHLFKIKLSAGLLTIHTQDQRVSAVWYDDPLGRWTARGRERKIHLHLARYGLLPGWTIWNQNDLLAGL